MTNLNCDDFFQFGRYYLLLLFIVTVKFILIITIVVQICGEVTKWDYKDCQPSLEQDFYTIKNVQS